MDFVRNLDELQECEERQFNKIRQKMHKMRSLTKENYFLKFWGWRYSE